MKEKDSNEFGLRIETGLSQIYKTLQIGEPTKKIRKIFAKSAKKVSKEIKAHLKNEVKQEAKKKKAALKALKKKELKGKAKAAPRTTRTGKAKSGNDKA